MLTLKFHSIKFLEFVIFIVIKKFSFFSGSSFISWNSIFNLRERLLFNGMEPTWVVHQGDEMTFERNSLTQLLKQTAIYTTIVTPIYNEKYSEKGNLLSSIRNSIDRSILCNERNVSILCVSMRFYNKKYKERLINLLQLTATDLKGKMNHTQINIFVHCFLNNIL